MQDTYEQRDAATAFEILLAAAQSGSSSARIGLWREYSPSVVRLAQRRGAHDPDELACDVFVAAFYRLEDFSGCEAEFRSFIYQLTCRRVVDRMRSEAPVVHSEPEAADDDVDDELSQQALAEGQSGAVLNRVARALCTQRRAAKHRLRKNVDGLRAAVQTRPSSGARSRT